MSAFHLRGRKTPAKADGDALTRKPKPPKHLSPFARAEWERVMPMLIARGMILKADLGIVEDFCVARGLVVELEIRRRAKDADMPKMLRLQNQAMLTAARLSASLGLDPSSRARLLASAAEDDDSDNPLDV